METFNFSPNWGVELAKKPKVKTLMLGDGYEQRLKQGLNNNLRSYSLAFSGDIERIKQIDNFLNRQEGYKAFLWQPRHSSLGKFKCEEWKMIINDTHATLSCEFKEVVA
ncbi:phage tail protein [Ursidibacter arcticus]